jgi:hypothetical protein
LLQKGVVPIFVNTIWIDYIVKTGPILAPNLSPSFKFPKNGLQKHKIIAGFSPILKKVKRCFAKEYFFQKNLNPVSH